MEIKFTLSKNAVAGMSDKPVMFPILVASSYLERPIIGFNVIEQPVNIPKNKVVVVPCGRLNKRVLSESHVVLEPNHETPWPTGLVIREQLIQLPSEDNGKIEVTVENLTDNDILLCSCMTLGWLHSVDAIYPSQTKSMVDQRLETRDSSSHLTCTAIKPDNTN